VKYFEENSKCGVVRGTEKLGDDVWDLYRFGVSGAQKS